MKRLYFTIIAVLVAITINAQKIKVYEYDEAGNLKESPAYTSTKKVKVVFTDNDENEELDLPSGAVVEGTREVNGCIIHTAIGGTVADFVDIGMRDEFGNKVLWATHNLGASKPEEYGAYIAWGELGSSEEGYVDGIKSHYAYDTYKFCDNVTYWGDNFYAYTKYYYDNDKERVCLESFDDAAYVNWGTKWQIPSYEHIDMLCDRSKFDWFYVYQDGIGGALIKSKINGYEGTSIFLPSNGVYGFGYTPSHNEGCYWVSSVAGDRDADYLHFLQQVHFSGNHSLGGRICGMGIRPVRIEK